MAKFVMLIDTVRCTGCHTCAMACRLENNLPDGVWWNQVFAGKTDDFTGDRSAFTQGKLIPYANLKVDVAQGSVEGNGGVVNTPTNKNITMTFYTKACQHCAKPACMEICPPEAIYKDPDTGIVDTHFDKCIGCDQCITACPYDVRHHNSAEETFFSPDKPIGGQGINKHKANTVDKCTFCSHRLPQGKKPACVDCCPAAARTFGNVQDLTSDAYRILSSRESKQLIPEKGTEPSVYFLL